MSTTPRELLVPTLAGVVGAGATYCAAGFAPWWTFPLALFLALWALMCMVLVPELVGSIVAGIREGARSTRCGCGCHHRPVQPPVILIDPIDDGRPT